MQRALKGTLHFSVLVSGVFLVVSVLRAANEENRKS